MTSAVSVNSAEHLPTRPRSARHGADASVGSSSAGLTRSVDGDEALSGQLKLLRPSTTLNDPQGSTPSESLNSKELLSVNPKSRRSSLAHASSMLTAPSTTIDASDIQVTEHRSRRPSSAANLPFRPAGGGDSGDEASPGQSGSQLDTSISYGSSHTQGLYASRASGLSTASAQQHTTYLGTLSPARSQAGLSASSRLSVSENPAIASSASRLSVSENSAARSNSSLYSFPTTPDHMLQPGQQQQQQGSPARGRPRSKSNGASSLNLASPIQLDMLAPVLRSSTSQSVSQRDLIAVVADAVRGSDAVKQAVIETHAGFFQRAISVSSDLRDPNDPNMQALAQTIEKLSASRRPSLFIPTAEQPASASSSAGVLPDAPDASQVAAAKARAAKRLWRRSMAMFLVRSGLKLLNLQISEMLKPNKDLGEQAASGGGGATEGNARQSQQAQADAEEKSIRDKISARLTIEQHRRALSVQVISLLAVPPEARSPNVVASIEAFLTTSLNLRGLSVFSAQERTKLCQVMMLDRQPENKLILMEGHRAYNFYLILGGKLEIFKGWDDAKYRARGSAKPPHDIKEIVLAAQRKLEQNISRVEAILPFERELIAKMIPCIQFKTYLPQQVIAERDAPSLQLMWVLSGTCRCIKEVPFVRRKPKSGIGAGVLLPLDPSALVAGGHPTAAQSTSDTELPPGSPRGTSRHSSGDSNHADHGQARRAVTALHPTDAVELQLLTIGEFGPSEHFPVLPFHETRLGDLDKPVYIQYLREHRDAVHTATIVANKHVELISMSQLEFVQLAPVELVHELMKSDVASFLNLPVARLQDAFLERREWNGFKRKIVGEIVDKRRQ
ncbi:hypothetical protein HK105_202503 [Polyrhizophydium stewartii]|uniref:Cyclic nucleotide-binding domain-containing protein n=1 Tax=Polyrhizophydium stewartii TaxID=2732419 RepID=A0ABR4NF44_9FUNG